MNAQRGQAVLFDPRELDLERRWMALPADHVLWQHSPSCDVQEGCPGPPGVGRLSGSPLLSRGGPEGSGGVSSLSAAGSVVGAGPGSG